MWVMLSPEPVMGQSWIRPWLLALYDLGRRQNNFDPRWVSLSSALTLLLPLLLSTIIQMLELLTCILYLLYLNLSIFLGKIIFQGLSFSSSISRHFSTTCLNKYQPLWGPLSFKISLFHPSCQYSVRVCFLNVKYPQYEQWNDNLMVQ
jgi:hypothetical protein